MDRRLVAFESSATFDDGTCPRFAGCMDSAADNYRSIANVDEGACLYAGCLQSDALNYDAHATLPAPCRLPPAQRAPIAHRGCIDPTRANFDSLARVSDGSCAPPQQHGCTRRTALNFQPDSTTDDGSCVVPGCTDRTSPRFDSEATHDDGCSCAGRCASRMRQLQTSGCCPLPGTINFDPTCSGADVDYGSCIFVFRGCTASLALNFNPTANIDDASCTYVAGCGHPDALNYNSLADAPGECIYGLPGCTDTAATNFNEHANTDDGSCRCVA